MAKVADIKKPTSTILCAEATMAIAPRPFHVIDSNASNGVIQKRHINMANILWIDGHVSSDKRGSELQMGVAVMKQFMGRN